jgi:hypothetical protein
MTRKIKILYLFYGSIKRIAEVIAAKRVQKYIHKVWQKKKG